MIVAGRARRKTRPASHEPPSPGSTAGGRAALGRWLTSPAAPVVVVGLCSLVVGLYGLGTKTIWWDEAFSIYFARQSLPILWHNVWDWQPNMMAYYFVLFVWLRLVAWAGMLPQEFIVRIPSALFGAGSAVVVFLLARRMWGQKVAVWAAGLYLLNTFAIQYAQEERSYSLQLLLLTLSWYGLFAALTTQKAKRWWALYIIASALAVYAQFVSALVILSQAAGFAILLALPTSWRTRVQGKFWDFAVGLTVVGALILPLMAAAEKDPHQTWVPIAHPQDLLSLAVTYSSSSPVYLALAIVLCALGVWSFGWPRLRRPAPAEVAAIGTSGVAATAEADAVVPGVVMLLCWLLIPVLFAYVTAQPALNLHLFLTRYLIVGVPAYTMLIALALAAIRPRLVQVALAVVLLGVALWPVPGYYASVDHLGYRAPTLWLQQRFRPGDGILYTPAFWAWLPMSYYMQAYPGPARSDHPDPAVYALDDNVTTSTYAATHSRVFLISAGGNGVVLSSDAQTWLDAHYHLIDSVVDSSVSIRLYATGPISESATPHADLPAPTGPHAGTVALESRGPPASGSLVAVVPQRQN